jgi:uncharacterized protein
MDQVSLFLCQTVTPFPSPDNAALQTPDMQTPDMQTVYLQRARVSLRQLLNRYTGYFNAARNRPALSNQDELQADMDQLSMALNKLENQVSRIAVFGLVSRGKSAVLNALLGRKVLPTGPLNGVTRVPQAIKWHAQLGHTTTPVELIDTPGLDEIDGQARADMAQRVARQADLILFVVSGDITRTEYDALCDLRQAQKPILLVFNKIDLYPDHSRQEIYTSLQRLAARSARGESLQTLLSANEIVRVAAEPAPVQVRVEHPDRKPTYQWEAPPVQIDELKAKISEILQREGQLLMALNGLVQVREAEERLANKTIELHDVDADELVWKFVRYKAIAIALNPIAFLDVAGGAVSDLAMIRALSELYGLPITRHEAAKLWKTILLSSGSLLLTEIGSGVVLGLGKSAAATAMSADGVNGLTVYAGAAIAQATLAGLGSYSVGRAAQAYLRQGCSWGPQGASTVIQDILSKVDRTTILYRLRQELTEQLGFPKI